MQGVLALLKTYNWSTIVTDTILALLFTGCAISIWLGNKNKFALTIAILMIVSNIGGLGTVIANYELTLKEINPDLKGTEFDLILQTLAATLRDGCFNGAHWYFSFTYLASAIAMPSIFNQKPASENSQLIKAIVYWIGLAVNEIVVIVYNIVTYMINHFILNNPDSSPTVT